MDNVGNYPLSIIHYPLSIIHYPLSIKELQATDPLSISVVKIKRVEK